MRVELMMADLQSAALATWLQRLIWDGNVTSLASVSVGKP